MFLSGVLFILILAGCWLLCLTDVATAPAAAFPGLSKRTWVAIVAATFILGAAAWYLTRPRRRARRWPQHLASHVTLGPDDGANWYQSRPLTAAEALARHPASQARRAAGEVHAVPLGPDDDPEFLRQLSERIKGTSDSSELPACLRFPYGSRSKAPQIGPG
jgi:hypothetical protein